VVFAGIGYAKMTDDGYVYAYRGVWHHPAFNNLREAAIWNFLYQNAFWQDGQRNFNGYTFNLKRGQIVVSISFLAKGFGMTEKGVRVVIQKLEKLGMLGVQGASRGTIITICNYDKYQKKQKTEGEPEGNRRASRGRAEGDNKNEGNEGNEGNIHAKSALQKPDDVSEQVWKDFTEHRKAKRAKVTQTALDGIRREAQKAGWPMDDALKEICTRGWQWFKSDWVESRKAETIENREWEWVLAPEGYASVNMVTMNGKNWIKKPKGMQ